MTQILKCHAWFLLMLCLLQDSKEQVQSQDTHLNSEICEGLIIEPTKHGISGAKKSSSYCPTLSDCGTLPGGVITAIAIG